MLLCAWRFALFSGAFFTAWLARERDLAATNVTRMQIMQAKVVARPDMLFIRRAAAVTHPQFAAGLGRRGACAHSPDQFHILLQASGASLGRTKRGVDWVQGLGV